MTTREAIASKKQKNTKKLVELEASLAPAEAEVGAVAQADQKANCGFL